MTRDDLARAVFDIDLALTKTEARAFVDGFIALLVETLASGHTVKLSGFGNFVVRDKKARPGINPRTREALVLPPHRVVRFKPSPILRAVVNSSDGPEYPLRIIQRTAT